MSHSEPCTHPVDIVEMMSSQINDLSLKKQGKRKGKKHEPDARKRFMERIEHLSTDELERIVTKVNTKKSSEGMATGFNTAKFFSPEFFHFIQNVSNQPDESQKVFLEKFKSCIKLNQCTRIVMGNMIRWYRDNATGEVEKKSFKIKYLKKDSSEQLVKHTRIKCPYLLELFFDGRHFFKQDEEGNYYMSEISLQQVLGLTLVKSSQKKIDLKSLLIANGFQQDFVTKRVKLDDGNGMRCVLVTGNLSRRISEMHAVLQESMQPELFRDLETRVGRFEKIKDEIDPSLVNDETLMVLTETCFQFICSVLFSPKM